jgi:hypothetical protein
MMTGRRCIHCKACHDTVIQSEQVGVIDELDTCKACLIEFWGNLVYGDIILQADNPKEKYLADTMSKILKYFWKDVSVKDRMI